MENISFCQRMMEAADARADKIAMMLIGTDGFETMTFGEMLSKIRGVAYRLTQERISFGDRVALIGKNHPNWVIAYLGILYRGAIAVPLDQAANTEALAHFIEDSDAKTRSSSARPIRAARCRTSSTWERASISPTHL
jgi:acyl-CoA synthetase (AMP-forming)/AMP-acid ligase II